MLVKMCLLNIFVCYILQLTFVDVALIVVMSSDVKIKIHTRTHCIYLQLFSRYTSQ